MFPQSGFSVLKVKDVMPDCNHLFREIFERDLRFFRERKRLKKYSGDEIGFIVGSALRRRYDVMCECHVVLFVLSKSQRVSAFQITI